MDDVPPALCAVIAVSGLLFLYSLFSPTSLRSIPTVGGPSAPLLSYIGAFKYVFHSQDFMLEGYKKYKGGFFKLAMLDRWVVVITSGQLLDELQRLPDDQVSLVEGIGELLSVKYIWGHDVDDRPYHIDIIRQKLTRSLAEVFPSMCEELAAAFDDYIPKSNDWVAVPALHTMQEIVARTSARTFVGAPMCRHRGYLDLAINFTYDVGKVRAYMGFVPPLLKTLASAFITSWKTRTALCLHYLQPTIAERYACMDKYGKEWPDRPNDILQWLLEEARAQGDDAAQVCRMLLVINFAAISTTSHSFTHALFHLAASPELMATLREEVEPVIQNDGWDKTSMTKMHKLDSFLRESQRFNGTASVTLIRKTLKPITFSNGVRLPANTLITAPQSAVHMDSENYANPDVFDPFRHLNTSGEAKESAATSRRHYVSTTPEYVPFGLGKHACPGRFFAANELKAMMAYVIMNYDLKFEDGVRPPNVRLSISILPNPKAKVLFRRRQT